MTRSPSQSGGSAASAAPAALTTDDLKQQVKRIRDSALEDVKHARDEAVASDSARMAGIVAGVIVVGLSLAYFAGARRSKRAADEAYRRLRESEQAEGLRLANALREIAGP